MRRTVGRLAPVYLASGWGEAGLRLKALLSGFTVGPGNCPSSLPAPLAQLYHREAQEAVGSGGRQAEALMRWTSTSWGHSYSLMDMTPLPLPSLPPPPSSGTCPLPRPVSAVWSL